MASRKRVGAGTARQGGATGEGIDRRSFLKLAAAAGVATLAPWDHWATALGATPRVRMAKFPEKTDLILQTDRPPQLETPAKYFAEEITPNEAFFVRWHVSGIPTKVDTGTFRLKLSGHVATPLELSVDDLKKNFEPVSVTAVCQCSGNSRSLFEPRVTGGQWGNGAAGNAKWTGVRLKDLLAKAGMKDGAQEVSFMGLDRPPLPDTPVFAKSLKVDKANDPDVIVAYAMNDADLPMLNGFPVRLVVPGWYATYWVKSLEQIEVWAKHYETFWMDKAYRIPNDPKANEKPDALAKDTVPISRMCVRALFATPAAGARVDAGKATTVQGVAFDGGTGIKKVEVSADGGKTWNDAKLGNDLGKFSFRKWTFDWTPTDKGKAKLMVRATANSGETQVDYMWNRSGYQRNVIEQLDVTVV
jgi:DMSO/TMAO reductase YedYZ molybdopterin-dependent catalytic subunit